MTEQVSERPEWQQLELLVADIQRQLAPDAKITHNAKIIGMQSETTRQIDVLVEQNIGQYSLRIALDCKDYSTPVDVKGVEEFYGLLVDIGAHKGALVCPSGFTKAAKIRANKLAIDLYSPADTDPHKWQVRLVIPTICDFRATTMSFGISSTAPMPIRLPERFFELDFFDSERNKLGKIIQVATERWDHGEYPFEPGNHDRLPLLPGIKTLIDNGYGTLIPVDLTLSLHVTRQRFVGHLPIEKLHGLRDEQTGLIITNAFEFRLLDPIEIQEHWTRLKSDEVLPYPIALTVTGLHSWGPL